MWAAILFLFSAAAWIARGAAGSIERLVVGMVYAVVGIRYLSLWKRQRVPLHREPAGDSFLLSRGCLLGVAAAAAIHAVAWPLIEQLLLGAYRKR